jgi:peptide/nickel transport system substrate-binding protein
MLTRRTLLAAGALLPRVAIAQADQRPSLTIAVQNISTSGTLEPMREQSNVGFRVMPSFAECMIEMDWTRTQRPRPGLATEWRRIDHRTVELTLRDGVKFHNGATLTAEDVAFSFSPARFAGVEADQRGLFVGTAQQAAGQRAEARADLDQRLA